MARDAGWTLEKAIEKMDAGAAWVAETKNGSDAAELRKLVRTLWTSETLLAKHPEYRFTERRTEFINEIAVRLDPYESNLANGIRMLLPALAQTDDGYAKILARTRQCEGSALLPLVQVSAVLSLAEKHATRLEAAHRDALLAGPDVRFQHTVEVDGQRVDPDVESFGMLKSSVTTIVMLAYPN
ncbi:hypothetical protein [Dyella sp. Tek66A03]|uniref:hypothetical protein n=1 Tax=Dyella sp. Tek66A03 TaxID=3458298 RepID=UPI00403EAC86